MPEPDKTVVIIAGPNGAGKTTFACAFLAQSGMRFINDGCRVVLYFWALQPMEMAIERVAQRVGQGRHAILEAVIGRRFVAGQRNVEQH